MKAIVANLLLGSMLYCLSSNFSVSANPSIEEESQPSQTLSAKALRYDNLMFLTPSIDLEVQDLIYSITPKDKDYLKQIIELDDWYLNRDISGINLVRDQFLPQGKKSQIHHGETGDFVLGVHKTFWDSDNKQKYWGLTTIQQWGDRKAEGLKLNQLNYKNSAPIVPEGTATLTVSGGGTSNLLPKNDILGDFEDFRGGVAYHHGLADNFTLGLGFVYEDFVSGFSQLTYQPSNFPLRTTISLLTAEEGVDIYSHLQFKPSQDFIVNFYSNSEEQKFDLNWGLASGVTLTAEGNSQQETLKTGAKIVFKNEFISFLAKAELDNNNDLQWQITSRVGHLQLIHATNSLKSKSEIKYDLGDYSDNFQCAIFFKHQTQELKQKEAQLAIWGLNFNSGKKVAGNRYSWQFELGYGVGSQGQGVIASAKTAINPKLFLKLTYEDIALKSDDTKIKLELTSK